MPKHTLLPETYKDSATHIAIISALKPYEMPNTQDISNPNTKWNLRKAWKDAGDLLEHSRWHYNDRMSFDPETAEYLLPAYTDEEIETSNTILAGIVARQILDPESNTAIRRIEYKKGGEVNIAISSSVAAGLREEFPEMELVGGPHGEEAKEEISFLKRIVNKLKFGRK